MKRSLLPSIFLLLAVSAFSQSTSWTGTVDSTWHNPSNWTSGVPDQATDVVIGDANFSGTYRPVVMAAASCKGLTVNSGFKLKVYTTDTITVGGNLTNNGFIQGDSASFAFEGNNVTLCGTGTAVYKSVYVLPGVNFTINKDINISGHLVVDGSLSAVGKTISFVGSTPSVITGNGTITLGDLVQNKSGSCTKLESPVTITGNLALSSGIIYTSASGLLTLADNATATSGNNSSYIDGPMEKIGDDAFVFPVGDNGVWARLGVTAPGVVSDGFIAQYHANAFSNTDSIALSAPVMVNVSKVEYWTCERSAGSANVAVTLYWQDNVRSDISDYSGIVVAHWNGSRWENTGNNGIVPLAQGSVTSEIQNAFSPFTLGSTSSANPMPVGFLNFSAEVTANHETKLEWETATETNNKFFSIERSADGLTFESLGSIDAAGTSLVRHSYGYNDAAPFQGNTYYRIKQVDYNGGHSYSVVRMIQVNDDRTDISVYPNPSNGRAFSVGLVRDAKISSIVLFNAVGQRVLQLPVTDQEFSRIDVMADAALPVGIYTLVAIGEESNYMKKLVVQK